MRFAVLFGMFEGEPENEEQAKAIEESMQLFDIDRAIRAAVEGLKVLIETDKKKV